MVQIEGLQKLLREHPFFDGMDDSTRDLIAGCAANEVFQEGDCIYREGEPADKFYFIRHGAVALEVHFPGRAPVIIDTLIEGDLLGWSWLIPPYRCTFDARAVGLVRAVSIDAKCLRAKCEADHSLGYDFFQRFLPVIADRLSAARLQLVDMYAGPQTATSVSSMAAKAKGKKGKKTKKAAKGSKASKKGN